jgi:hypothetical protein
MENLSSYIVPLSTILLSTLNALVNSVALWAFKHLAADICNNVTIGRVNAPFANI